MLPATEPRVFRIRGGNQQLPARLAAVAGAGVLTQASVEEVVLGEDGRYSLRLAAYRGSQHGCSCGDSGDGPAGGAAPPAAAGPKGGGQQRPLLNELREPALLALPPCGCAGGRGGQAGCEGRQLQEDSLTRSSSQPAANNLTMLGPFDVVIMATPLEAAALRFSGMPPPRRPPRSYQQTFVTLVQGHVAPEYFGLPPGEAMPYGEPGLRLLLTGPGAAGPQGAPSVHLAAARPPPPHAGHCKKRRGLAGGAAQAAGGGAGRGGPAGWRRACRGL